MDGWRKASPAPAPTLAGLTVALLAAEPVVLVEPKVALVAAMRKLLSAVQSVAKSRRPFVPHLTPAAAA